MSSYKRPWFKWWPKDFNQDEKVRCLSALAELVYRRALDVMWQNNSICLPNAKQLLYDSLGKGLTEEEFSIAWDRVQYTGFELFRVSEDKKWIYSSRLQKEKELMEKMLRDRSTAGKKGAAARWHDE